MQCSGIMSGRHKRQDSRSEPSGHRRQDSLTERRGSLPQLKTAGAGGAPPPSPQKRLTVTPRDAHLGAQLQVRAAQETALSMHDLCGKAVP